MSSHDSPVPRETLPKRVRILLLRRLVEEGEYLVPAEDLAGDILRHLGLLVGRPAPQQR